MMFDYTQSSLYLINFYNHYTFYLCDSLAYGHIIVSSIFMLLNKSYIFFLFLIKSFL